MCPGIQAYTRTGRHWRPVLMRDVRLRDDQAAPQPPSTATIAVDHLGHIRSEEERQVGNVHRLQERRDDAAVDAGLLRAYRIDLRLIDAGHDVGGHATHDHALQRIPCLA